MAVFVEFATLGKLWQIFSKVQPDLVHCITIKPVLYGGSIARLRGITAIFAISGLGYLFISTGLKARLFRLLASVAYKFVLRGPRSTAIFQNEDDRHLFLDRHLVLQADTVLIPGCGTDTELFCPADSPPSEPVVVMLPARLQLEKGVREFVEAADILTERGIDARMVLVGYADFDRPGGISEAELREWCESRNVEWWGHSTDMPRTLRQAHIVCLPSYREGFPKVLIEAAACGLPVITTDVPGCRDAVRVDETALLVPARDATELAKALERLITDRDLRTRMGDAGRELVQSHYSEDRFVSQSMRLYDERLAELGAK